MDEDFQQSPKQKFELCCQKTTTGNIHFEGVSHINANFHSKSYERTALALGTGNSQCAQDSWEEPLALTTTCRKKIAEELMERKQGRPHDFEREPAEQLRNNKKDA
jgi:hypothetical protein